MPYLPTVNVRGLCPRAGLNEKDPAVSQVPEDIHWSRVAIRFPTLLAENLGLGRCAVNQSAVGGSVPGGSAQPAVPIAHYRPHALRPGSAPLRGGGGARPSSTRLPTRRWPYHRGGHPEAGRVLRRNRTRGHRDRGAETAAPHPRPLHPRSQTLSTFLSIANWLAAASRETAPPLSGEAVSPADVLS
jgi:hypothetical protein